MKIKQIPFPLGESGTHVSGKGEMLLKVYNTELSVNLALIYNDQKCLQITAVEINLTVGEIYVKLTNLMDGSEDGDLFNNLLNFVIMDIFNKYEEALINDLKQIIMEKGNEILGQHPIPKGGSIDKLVF